LSAQSEPVNLPALNLYRPMKRFRKSYVYLTATLLGAVAMTAQAGPEPLEKTVAPTPPAEIDWAGPYIGFNVGAVWNHYDVSNYSTDVDLEEQFYEAVDTRGNFVNVTSFPVDGRSATETGGIGGGQLGYNLQFGHFVVGVEGGFSGVGTKTGGKREAFQVNPLGFIGIIQLGDVFAETSFSSWRVAETTWNGYFGGQLGYAWWRLLFYGNGGAAFTDLHVMAIDRAHTDFFESNVCGPFDQPCVSSNQDQLGVFLGGVTNTSRPTDSDVLTGWYGGGGIQYALNDVVRAGFEYRHCDFGDQTVNFRSGGPVFPGRTRFGLDSDQLTFRVNIMLGRLGHFGP
jgi:outer membrane immunogenic protein